MPKSDNTAAALDRARENLQAIEKEISDLARKREQKLLAGDNVHSFVKVDGELERLRSNAAVERDRIALLEQEVEREEQERRARAREAQIKRIEERFAERDRIAAELQATIGNADKFFRDLVEASREIDAAWPWQPHDRLALTLPAEYIVGAIRHEIFRLSKPQPTGVQGYSSEPNFPGGKSPTIQLAGQPDKVPELAKVFAQASEVASQILHTGKGTDAPDFVAPAVAGVPVPFLKDELKPPLTANEAKLGELLRAQIAFANDMSEEGERAYQEIVAAIASLQGEIDAAKGTQQ